MPRALALALVLLAVVAGCQRGGDRRQDAEDEPIVYVAVGASETVGVGADRPAEQAWPAVFASAVLDGDDRYVNTGISGATVEDALAREVPKALAEKPTLVTVWLNVNDLIRQVPPETYEQRLRQLVRELRQGGRARVLVANTPPLDRLPAYTSRLRGFPFLPGPETVSAAVGRYNEAIARVVREEGAELVDLHAAGLRARAEGKEMSYISADGFHPSTAGHAAVAAEFERAFRAR